MDKRDPVDWDSIEKAVGRSARACEEVFENHHEEIEEGSTVQEAVWHLDTIWKSKPEDERSVPDQGAAYLFAYLLEKEGIVSYNLNESETSIEPKSLVDRKPDAETLRKLFWEDELVLWQIAVEYGVHYSLVTYWFWEEDVPLMRWNITQERLEKIDAMQSS